MAVQEPVQQTAADPKALMQMIMGAWVSQAVYASAKVGVYDQLINGPKSSDELAKACNAHPRSLFRLLRLLVKVGLLQQEKETVFSLSPLGQFLRSDHPAGFRPIALMAGEEHYQAWGSLVHSIQTGESAFDHVFNTKAFEYFETHPESSEIFNQAMSVFSKQSAAAATAYDFSRFNTIMDVAGGHGVLLGAILKANPNLKGQLFDLSHVTDGAKAVLEPLGVADRVEILSGDFFKSIPSGADAYIFSHIIHDWSDELSLQILKNCHAAMPADGTLLLLEHVVGSPNATPVTNMMDINMLVMTHGGCERTEAEFAALFDAAGFRMTRLVPVPGLERYLVEGVKK